MSLRDLSVYVMNSEEMSAFVKHLSSLEPIDEVMGISTCNRTEIYASVHSVKDAAHAIVHEIAVRSGALLETLRKELDVLVDAAAVEHLFQVASGLDSMVVGDAQILGQMKEAYQQASDLGTTRAVLHKLVQSAFSTAKRIRNETDLGTGRVSIGSLAVDSAEEFFGDLQSVVATVIGAGKMGRLTSKYLTAAGVKELRIINRSADKSLELANEFGAKVYSMDEIDRVLIESDLVIAGTAAPDPLLTRAMLASAARVEPKQRLLIDIAIPPDIETAAGNVEGVRLIDLEELRVQAAKNLETRAHAVEQANEILTEELEELGPWPIPFHINTLANQLGEYANRIFQEELTSLFDALPELTPSQREIIKAKMQRMSERIVLPPRRNIRKHGSVRTCPNAAQCIAELFQTECGARTPLLAETLDNDPND